MKLTTHRLVPNLRMSGAKPPHILYALMAWIWTPFFDTTSLVSNYALIASYGKLGRGGISPKSRRAVGENASCYLHGRRDEVIGLLYPVACLLATLSSW